MAPRTNAQRNFVARPSLIEGRRRAPQPLGQAQRRDDRPISGQQLGRPKLPTPAPSERLTIETAGLTAIAAYHPHIEQHLPIGILVAQAQKGARMLDCDAQFFFELACKRPGAGLTRLDLAARKFPGTGEVLARRPLSDEHPALPVEEHGRSDVDCPRVLLGARG